MKRAKGFLGQLTDVSRLPMPEDDEYGIQFFCNEHFIEALDMGTHFLLSITDPNNYEWQQKFAHNAFNRGFRWRKVREYIKTHCFPKAILYSERQ